MPIQALSPLNYQPISPSQVQVDLRHQAKANDESCLSTAIKVLVVAGGLLTSAGSFLVLGPLAGLVVTLICGITGTWLLNSCNADPHSTHRHPASPRFPITPFYQPFFPVVTPYSSPPPPAQHYVSVGNQHVEPPPPSFWQRLFSPIHFTAPRATSHVPRGYAPGPYVPVGHGQRTPPPVVRHQGGPSPGPYVPVGRGGPITPPVIHQSRVPPVYVPVGQTPPPNSPRGHVPVGRRYN
jgi:hypothetical protein